jgi:hypothetical protein
MTKPYKTIPLKKWNCSLSEVTLRLTFCLEKPGSMTKTTPSMVSEVSAMFVDTTTWKKRIIGKYHIISVAIRIRDPVLFYPKNPGSGMNFFRIPDLGSQT